jgi:CheY-like chemotaxis protein
MLLKDLAAMARPSLGPGITLRLICDLPPGRVLLDPGPLQDSLLNVLLNARDAMAGRGRIELRARVTTSWIELTVCDSGPGFTPVALKRGTEPFFTSKPGQGSGLGLSMVYDQTKLAGGTLRLDNAPGGGARVRIRLPLRHAAPRMTLLVDDDEQVRESVREMLTGLGHSVIEAGSLAEALALCDLPDLSLVLSDLQLGDGQGTELARTGLALVLMTALPPGHADRAGLSGPVLTKPFAPADLAALLERLPVDE